MNGRPRSFDWGSFLVRLGVILVLVTVGLFGTIRKHNHLGTVVIASIGFVFLPIMAYIHTRYFNTTGIGWLIRAVKRMTQGTAHDRAPRG
jgi:hypothetical protein